MAAIQTQIVIDEQLAKLLPEFVNFQGKKVRISIEEIFDRNERHPVFGAGAGRVHLKENWDAPIDDFEEYL